LVQKKEFDLEHQYQLYLKRVALSEDNMHPEQKKQLRQTFMGACGQMIFLLRDEVGALSTDDGIEALESMKRQVGDYFMKQTNKYN